MSTAILIITTLRSPKLELLKKINNYGFFKTFYIAILKGLPKTSMVTAKTTVMLGLISLMGLPGLYTLYADEPIQPGTVSDDYIQEYIQKAIQSYKQGNYHEALESVRHVITADMQNLRLRYLAAHSYWKSKNYESAVAHFKAFIEFKSDSPSPYIDLALLYVEEKDYKKARSTLANGIKTLKKKNKKVPIKFFNIMARIHFYENQPDKVIAYTSQAKAKFNSHRGSICDKLETLMLESRAYLLKKNFSKAEVSALWATESGVTNEYALNLLGYVYLLWAEATPDSKEEDKESLYKNAKENFEKALYHLNKSSALRQAINNNLKRIVL